MRQLLDGKEYPVAKGDILKKGFGRKADVELCVSYLHGLSQLTGCPRYTSDRIISYTCLQLFPIDNNAMLGSSQFMVDFQGMRFNTKKYLYIDFWDHTSGFCKKMLSTINGGGRGRCYVLPKSVCATKNNDLKNGG